MDIYKILEVAFLKEEKCKCLPSLTQTNTFAGAGEHWSLCVASAVSVAMGSLPQTSVVEIQRAKYPKYGNLE